jgi:hypothetical protein
VIVVDTGVLYALADRSDAHHRAVDWLRQLDTPAVVPGPVIAEACYLIGTNLGPGPEAAFLDAVGPDGRFGLAALTDPDLPRMAELVRRYADLPWVVPTRPSSPWPSAWAPPP